MTLEIEEGTFYMVQLPQSKTLHQSEEDAIDHLQKHADGLSAESDEISIVKVSVEGEDWTIAEMPWQNIAIRLMGD